MRTTPPILTPRLQQIADKIQPCACVADIGTDHAYLPVFLCMTQKAEKAIASDIRKGPIARAEATILRYGMQRQVETRLGGGADTLQVGEADCIVIAGMGGLMIAEILKENPAIFAQAGQILLQPMTAVFELRTYLFEHGYTILEETLAKEEEKLYHILSVTAAREEAEPTEEELYFGKTLMANKPEHFDAYIQKQRRKLTRMAEGLQNSQTPDAQTRFKQVQSLLDAIKGENLC